MTSTRILITGVSSPWGGRLAQLLERDRHVAALVGVDEHDPQHEFQRAEFVRVKTDEALLRRIIGAAGIDTVIDTRLVSDPGTGALAEAHAVNVEGTRALLSACAGAGSQPWGTVFTAMQLRRIGLRVPVEMLRQLRYGRGLDNRKLKATGFAYRYTTREAVLKVRAHERLRPLLQSGAEAYRYEREVEEFLRWSPSVQSADGPRGGADGSAGVLEGLAEGELLELIASMDLESLRELRRYEAAHGRREGVLDALDRQLARRAAIDAS